MLDVKPVAEVSPQTVKPGQLVAVPWFLDAEHSYDLLSEMEFSRVFVAVFIVSFGEGLYSAIWRGFSWCRVEGVFM